MNRAQTGEQGERTAAQWLRRAGYELCDINWRQGRYELDIVARRAGVLHFVEVKTRRAGSLTTPEEALTPQKCRALQHAADQYLAAHRFEGWDVQYDLAAVDVLPDGTMQVRFIENVLEPHW